MMWQTPSGLKPVNHERVPRSQFRPMCVVQGTKTPKESQDGQKTGMAGTKLSDSVNNAEPRPFLIGARW